MHLVCGRHSGYLTRRSLELRLFRPCERGEQLPCTKISLLHLLQDTETQILSPPTRTAPHTFTTPQNPAKTLCMRREGEHSLEGSQNWCLKRWRSITSTSTASSLITAPTHASCVCGTGRTGRKSAFIRGAEEASRRGSRRPMDRSSLRTPGDPAIADYLGRGFISRLHCRPFTR